MLLQNSVDIVIPVYNALDELKDCLDSILKHTNLVSNRVIIINDSSTDPNINIYLNEVNINNVIIMQNEQNLGFVSTVNRGMDYSNHDVILLNSDTVVTKGWLEKLSQAAYSHESIATVTPFTNNGTICSVPNFCEDNVLPDGYDINSFADLIEKISFKQYPELPTAVGFCMYIKRNVIDEIGLFDDISFNKGYGEENDFCCRAIENGYKNILADDTFVYHKGSMSFKKEKEALIKENSKKLLKKHPNYDQSVYEFIHVYNPLKKLHDNIFFYLDQYRFGNTIERNILYLCHNFFDQEYNQPVGGTEYHLKDIVSNLDGFNAFVLVSNYQELILKHYRNGKVINKYYFKLDYPITALHFHHKQYAEYLEKIMLSFEIDILHIQHLKRHSFDAPYIAKKLGIPTIFTLHDYYLLTPKHEFDFLELFGEYQSDYLAQHFVQNWQKQVRKLIEIVDLFIAPSYNTKENYLLNYKDMDILVIEHGIHLNEKKKEISNQVSIPLKFGFIGGLSPIKGSEIIYNIIKSYDKVNFEWHLIGGIGDQKLKLLEQKNLFKHGIYERDQLSEILDQTPLDIAVFLSQAPETFSYTLSEAWANQLPVIVSPVGALKERTERNDAGWILEKNDIESFNKVVKEITANSSENILRVKHILSDLKLMSVTDMTHIYQNIYREKYQKRLSTISKGFEFYELYRAKKYFSSPEVPSGESNNYIDFLEKELQAIRGTIGWKVLEKVRIESKWVLNIGKKVIRLLLKFKRK